MERDLAVLATMLSERLPEITSRAMHAAFESSGRRVVAEADAPEIVDLIEDALKSRRPYSAIRLGDGESAILAYGDAANLTPTLARFAAEKSVTQNVDRLMPTHEALVKIRAALLEATAHADILGVLGLWPEIIKDGRGMTTDAATAFLAIEPRGLSGQVRGRFLALQLNAELPRDIVFAPAHFYAAVIRGLDRLLAAATRVICVTSSEAAVEIVRGRANGIPVEHLPVGTVEGCAVTPREGLRDVAARLPGGPGVLHLIGAGIWAELYCDMVKRRGGVGVDLGSGFDLLAGSRTRPIHETIEALIRLDPAERTWYARTNVGTPFK